MGLVQAFVSKLLQLTVASVLASLVCQLDETLSAGGRHDSALEPFGTWPPLIVHEAAERLITHWR